MSPDRIIQDALRALAGDAFYYGRSSIHRNDNPIYECAHRCPGAVRRVGAFNVGCSMRGDDEADHEYWIRVYRDGEWDDFTKPKAEVEDCETLAAFLGEVIRREVQPLVAQKLEDMPVEAARAKTETDGPCSRKAWYRTTIDRGVYSGDSNSSDFLRWAAPSWGWRFEWCASTLAFSTSYTLTAYHRDHGAWEVKDYEALYRLGASGFVAQFWRTAKDGDLTELQKYMKQKVTRASRT